MTETTNTTLAERARGIANELFSSDEFACSSGKESCIQAEEKRALTKEENRKGWVRRPFYAYSEQNMCSGCAAYWHAEMAAQALERKAAWDSRIEARKAVAQ